MNKIHYKLLIIFTLFLSTSLVAEEGIILKFDTGSRILATSGVSQVEGSAGGGIVPWAVLSGYGQRDEWGGSAFGTFLETDDYKFYSTGVSTSFNNRVEFSLSLQTLEIDALQNALGLPKDELRQVTAGAKVRLFGDLIYGDLPQVSAGVQYKRNLDFDIASIAGATNDSGIDLYLSASRLWLTGVAGYPLLFNMTLRSTDANQIGLLGFGGDLNRSREIMFEGSVGLLLRRNLVVGLDYRQKPNNLSFANEDDWMDAFIAWFPNKHLSVTAAYADLGDVASLEDQDGLYFSIQGSF